MDVSEIVVSSGCVARLWLSWSILVARYGRRVLSFFVVVMLEGGSNPAVLVLLRFPSSSWKLMMVEGKRFAA